MNKEYIDFEIFKDIDFVNCKVSTKHGGVSSGYYGTMNLSFSIGDNAENVFKNYQIFSEKYGFNYKNIQRGYQTHGTNVSIVDKDINEFSKVPQFSDTDILITNKINTPLVTLFADCVPVFLVDTKNKAIAVIHSGWRGTLNNAVSVAVKKMNELYGTNKECLVAGIGPSIHDCCFLVDDDVFLEFNNFKKYHKYIKKVGEKYSINLQEINKQNLLETNLIEEKNIEISEYCTSCKSHLFHSHRRQKLERGSMAGFLEIKY